MSDIDTANHCCVTRDMAGMIHVQNPVPLLGKPLTPDAALVLAAWLVALADPDGERFAAVLEKVRNA